VILKLEQIQKTRTNPTNPQTNPKKGLIEKKAHHIEEDL